MKKTITTTLLLVWFVMHGLAQRHSEDWNFGWRFHPGQTDPHNMQTEGWRTVDLPHDFQIEQPWVAPSPDEKENHVDAASNFKSRLSARAFKEMGEGWYAKTFTPDASLKSKRILIDFEGIMYIGDVYLNGEHIGGTDYGYVGFEIDLSGKLKYGEQNTIMVRASTGNPADSRWYTGSGLFRDVRLVTTNARMYFVCHPLYITTRNTKRSTCRSRWPITAKKTKWTCRSLYGTGKDMPSIPSDSTCRSTGAAEPTN